MVGIASTTSVCCAALSHLLGDKIIFPGDGPYYSSVSSYYAAQDRSTEPGCIALPETVHDVSTVITSLTDTGGCNFAIRSGGHSSATGGSTIADGVTIDLRGLDTLEVSSDRSTVSIGIGNTWGDVYSHLDPLGLAVPGGRAATVGVGGLSLGGGISFFSTRYGWTTDNIINFQVVLADGSIVNANTDDDPDLLWALRGGTNNFGVVTRIDMATFEQGPFWGGYAYFPGDTWPQQVKELVSINSADEYDEYAHITMSWGFAPGLGTVVSNQLQYTQEGVENPAIFDGILALPSLVSVLRTTTHSAFTADIAQQSPGGSRRFWSTQTLVSTEAVLNATYIRFNESLSAVESIDGLVWALSLQPLPPAFYARNADGNCLGLEDRDGQALVTVLMGTTWTSEADDAVVEAAAKKLMADIEQDARALGDWDRYLYLNYASEEQDPIASYGHDNVDRLRRIAQRVDPDQIFTHAVPGGFKLW